LLTIGAGMIGAFADASSLPVALTVGSCPFPPPQAVSATRDRPRPIAA
jgi:hypothetical protein